MVMNYNNFNNRLEELQSEEATLEKYLAEGATSMESAEIEAINNKLVAIRAEKQEIDQLSNGAFY